MLSTFTHPAVAVLLFMSVLFIVAQLLKDNSIVDIGWGIGFILIALLILVQYKVLSARSVIVTLLVILWGLRLAIHILLRNRGRGEDLRYAKWRRDWGRLFILRSYFQIFILQGLLMMIIAAPVITVNSSLSSSLRISDFAGLMIWTAGFLFEAVGDWQLARFKRNPDNRGAVMDKGLWRYTRHPNYFGEVMIWWGFFLLALGVPKGWITFISPVLITFLLLRISGVTMLESALHDRKPGYREYVERTSVFIPWFPRR